MTRSAGDRAYVGSIPQVYDQVLVPLIFETYAQALAQRAAQLAPARVLETAAGTGAVTRALARALPAATTLVATDLNAPMLDRAASNGAARAVHWQVADALALPFGAASFDLLVCQFRAMFFPERAGAWSEAHQVLRPDGWLLFDVWDTLDHNDFARIVTHTLAGLYPDDPPAFLARTPHGYHDRAALRADLRAGGFTCDAVVETVAARSRAPSPREPALGFCQGTPLRAEIEAQPDADLDAATRACERAIARAHGSGPVQGRLQAVVVAVQA